MKKLLTGLAAFSLFIIPGICSAQPGSTDGNPSNPHGAPPMDARFQNEPLDHEVIEAIAKTSGLPLDRVPAIINQQGHLSSFIEN